MRRTLTFALVAGMLVISGCATKGYVRQRVEPLDARLGEVAQKSDQQGVRIEQVEKDVEQTDSRISSTQEKLSTVEGRLSDVFEKTDQHGRELGELRQVLGNLDDYSLAAEATVNFDFDRDTLTPAGQAELDQFVAQSGNAKRFVVTVEGFTDTVGSEEYNLALSRRRAESVVRYLTLKHSVPVFRIFVLGYGQQKLAAEERTREDRARNRRVEIRCYAAGATGDVGAASARSH